MASYAEGLNIMHMPTRQAKADRGRRDHAAASPEYYPYNLNIADIAEVWRRGSVIASWLLDLTAISLLDSPDLAKFAGRVSDSGKALDDRRRIDESVPAPPQRRALRTLQLAREDDFAEKVLSLCVFSLAP